MGSELRRLRNHRRVDVTYRITVIRRERKDVPQQRAAVGVLPLLGSGKMRPKIAESQRSQDRIADRVQQNIGVGMTRETAIVRNRDAADDERATFDQRVRIKTVADADVHSSARNKTGASLSAR